MAFGIFGSQAGNGVENLLTKFSVNTDGLDERIEVDVFVSNAGFGEAFVEFVGNGQTFFSTVGNTGVIHEESGDFSVMFGYERKNFFVAFLFEVDGVDHGLELGL